MESFLTTMLQQKAPETLRPPVERPLLKLSVSLYDTYKRSNPTLYPKGDAIRVTRSKTKGEKSQGTYRNEWLNEHPYYIVKPGEMLNERYKLKQSISQGAFGQVFRAEDTVTKQEVAIKIIQSKENSLWQAEREIKLLKHLSKKDQQDEHNIVRFLNHFMHRNHQCLVFESLSLNLFELLKSTQFCGLPLSRTRKIAKQVLQALSFLARKDVDVLHCDLKPENIVLKDPNKSDVKVIDFGASRMSNIDMYSYIQSRSYRAPEVMLGLPYNVAIDMWSLGCILVELHNGRALFPSFHELDLMQKIVGTLGMMPHEMLERVKDHRRQQFFKAKRSSSGESIWKLKKAIVLLTQDSTPKLVRQKASADPIASLNKIVQLGAINQKVCPVESAENYAQFVDLVYKMLAIEPNARITPHEALHHPFIAERRYRQTDIRTFLRPLKRIRIEENEE